LSFEKAMMAFWPGPLTIVTRARPGVPIEITAGTETIGLRLPIVDSVREFVRQCGGALTATSANLSGKPPARNAFELMNQFPEGLDLIVDSGELTAIEPSTVLDITSSPVKLIREGAISRATIQGVFDLA
jgi:L-threonylcarbamoyladenylate synthase